MLPKAVSLISVALQIFFGVSHATRQAPRVFSEGYIEGLYGRFFEYSDQGASSPCPRVIDHFNRGFPSALGNSWTVPHDKIIQNGVKCGDRAVLVLDSFNSTSTMPDRIKSNHIAVETFTHMKRDSTGFWMGADARTCGKWVFPNPSFVFFVKEFDRAITTSFRLRLDAGQKYMFVVAPKFTCIYLDVPRRSPDPDVVLTPGDGDSQSQGTNVAPATGSSDDAQAEDSTDKEPSSDSADKEPSSQVTEDTGETDDGAEDSTDKEPSSDSTDKEPPSQVNEDSDETDDGDIDDGDSDLSIIDIQSGATPKPTQTPKPGTIQDVLENEDDDDPITAILNEGDGSAGASETSESFDVTTQAGDSLCFPSSATVELTNGRIIRMDELSIGDEIRFGNGYSRVFGFSHKDPYARHSFIRMTTRSGKSIALTAGHYLYANNRLTSAKEVRIGDRLRLVTGDGIVERVETVTRSGLYNPQTLHGDIVVNGVIASCYTTAVSSWSAHALLTPLRAVWRLCRLRMLSPFEAGSLNNELAQWWNSIPHLEL